MEEDVTGAVVYDLDSRVLDAEVRVRGGKLTVKLDLPIYAVIELKK